MTAREERFEGLLAATSRELLRYLERRLGPDEAQDALSEAMVVAWRRSDDLPDDDAEARLWLYGVARNVVLNARRGTVRRSRLARRVVLGADRVPSAGGPEAGVEVRDAIARLGRDEAELVRLVHWEGFSLVEASRVLGQPPSTVRSRYDRARRALRAALGPVDSPCPEPDRPRSAPDRAWGGGVASPVGLRVLPGVESPR